MVHGQQGFSLPLWLLSIVRSRKVWLAVLGVTGGVVLYAQGAIDAKVLVNLILGLVSAVIVAIGIEDAGEKSYRGARGTT